MITTANCFDNEEFCSWWEKVEDENGNQGWDDDSRLERLVELFITNYSPDFAVTCIKEEFFDDEFPPMYDL